MRVIAGEFRSRKILSVPGTETRPTPDRVRESLFNILQTELDGTVFIDAYAGTGAVGIEALSRGARHVILIEKSRDAAAIIQQNLTTLKAQYRTRVILGNVATNLAKLDADIVFLDPPYDKEREYQAAFDALEGKQPKLLIVQHARRFAPPAFCGKLKLARVVTQGDNSLSFYRAPESLG